MLSQGYLSIIIMIIYNFGFKIKLALGN